MIPANLFAAQRQQERRAAVKRRGGEADVAPFAVHLPHHLALDRLPSSAFKKRIETRQEACQLRRGERIHTEHEERLLVGVKRDVEGKHQVVGNGRGGEVRLGPRQVGGQGDQPRRRGFGKRCKVGHAAPSIRPRWGGIREACLV